jgi:hypothetical protein
MDVKHAQSEAESDAQRIVRRAFADCRAEDAIVQLAEALHPEDLALVVLFVSAQGEINRLIAEAKTRLAPAEVVGCTTAGEISPHGYAENAIVAIGFPASHFVASTLLIQDLGSYDAQAIIDRMIQNRNQLAAAAPDWQSEFTFLMIDGMSRKEDALTADLSVGLGPVPLFGGSAGDGNAFEKTHVFHRGRACNNAAVLIQIRSVCPIRVFKTDHLHPTGLRMVVTGANPAERLVHEINAEPAARELARMLGKDPEQLTTFTFASHPVVVRIGDQHHVRAIQRVKPNGDLVFFSAIDEGVVLTLAEPEHMVSHLNREMQALRSEQVPDTVLACDCMLRRVEAEQKQLVGEISQILADNRVVGFSTYGEQVNSMHVNQTLTGVAIYPPKQG